MLSALHWYDWAIFYCCGVILGLVCWLTGRGDRIYHEKKKWVEPLCTLIWPIFLPGSFLALFGIISVWGLIVCVSISRLLKAKFIVTTKIKIFLLEWLNEETE